MLVVAGVLAGQQFWSHRLRGPHTAWKHHCVMSDSQAPTSKHPQAASCM